MSDNQQDLFAEDHEMIGQLFDKLEQIPDEELAESWSVVLDKLVQLIKAEFKRQGKVCENKSIEKIVLVISNYLGGRAIYLPRADRLKEALRDYAIYDDFNGSNVRQLGEHYGLSEPHIYAIIRKQRNIIKKRHQPELPY
ncbi:Mor transcription activator family protein [Aggregatibacter actinomycetemcomitans]|uniref:Mor transcription activator family protein n=1 Tax=Aggregatibacter actinomycetemcomitans TaxID=714 RepID=UPI0011DC3A29|nr:Mor transcription activator family protein [Aggregatibacter actinomycetemcomitans]TYB11841.1 transcriptional regulator [Aggregatibacter actinomycetemcomitans]